MAQIYVTECLNTIKKLILFIKQEIEKYDLSGLTNNYIGDKINIVESHPLALEYGAMLDADTDNYTSPLPVIGVDLTNDDPDVQLLGENEGQIEITQGMIDAWSAVAMKDRFDEGFMLSDETLQLIQDTKDAVSGKLWATKWDYLQRQVLNVSIWSDNKVITSIVYYVLRSILKSAKRYMSSIGMKNVVVTALGALYNYEFGRVLSGMEFNFEGIVSMRNILLDTGDLVKTIAEVEEYYPHNTLNDGTPDIKGPKFVSKGGN